MSMQPGKNYENTAGVQQSSNLAAQAQQTTETAGRQDFRNPAAQQPVGEGEVPFKEQVKGHAKKIAGTVFNKEHEKELGEKKLRGEI